LAELVSNYGVWLVAAFIALESVGIPLPFASDLASTSTGDGGNRFRQPNICLRWIPVKRPTPSV